MAEESPKPSSTLSILPTRIITHITGPFDARIPFFRATALQYGVVHPKVDPRYLVMTGFLFEN